MSFLLDTNVVSELRRRSGSRDVRAWVASTSPSERFLSVLTVGEIRSGIERRRRRDAGAATTLDAWLASLIVEHEGRILPITLGVAERFARLTVPDPLAFVDGHLAATALENGLTLVTRNTCDLARTGVPLLDPWNPRP